MRGLRDFAENPAVNIVVKDFCKGEWEVQSFNGGILNSIPPYLMHENLEGELPRSSTGTCRNRLIPLFPANTLC